MPKIIAINSLKSASRFKPYWTYFLISENKRLIKIGSTIQPLEKRILGVNNEPNYKGYNFSLYLAVRGMHLEEFFHDHFKNYRACFRWREEDGTYTYLTGKESWKRSLANTPIKGEHTRKLRAHWYFNYNAMHTRLELFKFPPRKVLPNLKSLIFSALKERGDIVVFKEKPDLTRPLKDK